MTLFEKIINVLEIHGIEYELTMHEPVHTSEEAATIRGVDVRYGAKAMVCIADEQPVMLVLSGAKKIAMKQFKQQFRYERVRFATPEEVEAVTSVKIGAVPPFGSLMDIKTYVDASMLGSSMMYFNPGRHDASIGMLYADYADVERHILGEFSE